MAASGRAFSTPVALGKRRELDAYPELKGRRIGTECAPTDVDRRWAEVVWRATIRERGLVESELGARVSVRVVLGEERKRSLWVSGMVAV